MKFWKNNRLDAEFERDSSQVAQQFWTSPYGGAQLRGSTWPLERSLRAFLTDPQGFNATWDDEASFARLLDAVRDTWPQPVTAETDLSAAVPGRVSDSAEHSPS